MAELADCVEQWEDLAAHALEPNVFYEPWLLLPALRQYGAQKQLLFLLVFAEDPTRPLAPPQLIGLLPLERRRYCALPVAMLGFWQYPHCFLCTPLVRAGRAAACLGALFDWLASEPQGTSLFELPLQNENGPWHRALIERLHQHGTPTFSARRYVRAFFEPASDLESYLTEALPGKTRRELRRQWHRLSELGELVATTLGPEHDAEIWLTDFLRLEASGWKGLQGTALAIRDADRIFFRALVSEAYRRGRLMMTALRLNDRPVAMKCSLLAGDGSFSFKIAYDEAYSRFSPGVLLELDNIGRLHAQRKVRWMDSCAEADHPMIDRLWTGRRTVESLIVSSGRRPGDLIVSLLPLLKWLKRKLLGRNPANCFSVQRGRP
jgi:CelD/BcsL family acetyltransferase involved in cellulose biosynthesis